MTVTGLPAAALVEDVLGIRVEVDTTSTRSGLDRGLDSVTADDLAAAGDREPVGRLLPVAPAETGDLTPPHPGGGNQVKRRIQLHVPGGSQDWVSWPAVQYSGPDRSRARGLGGRSAVRRWRQPVPPLGIGQRGTDDDVDVVDRLRREPEARGDELVGA